jgi:predicted Zn-dependent protease
MAIYRHNPAYDSPARPRIPVKFFLGLAVAAIALISYCSKSQVNPVTGKTQHIGLSTQQEIAMGLQAAPEMARQFGGLHPDQKAQDIVDAVGQELVAVLPPEAGQYQYEFHLLADPKTVNAFALPGGQIFITAALFQRLETRGQLAGVLGHEIGHVVGRHSAERIASSELTQGLIGAATVGASDYVDPRATQQITGIVGNMILMKYGRGDELESDRLGLRFMADAGYDPRALIAVMEILREASGGGEGGRPEFMSTHPDPGNRIEQIQQELARMFPAGVPAGMRE